MAQEEAPTLVEFSNGWQYFKWHINSNKYNTVGYTLSDHGYTDSISASTFTVQEIIKNYPGPFQLCCSGGMDSQAMLWAWGTATNWNPDIFSVTSFIYDNGCNLDDMEYIQEMCDQYGITRHCVDFPLLDFMLSGECTEYQVKYLTQSPHMATHIKFTEVFDSGTVLFSGELLSDAENMFSGTVNHFGFIKYSMDYNQFNSHKKIIPMFFEHNDIIGSAHINNYQDNRSEQIPEAPRHDQIREIKKHKYNSCGYPVKQQSYKGLTSGFNGFKQLYEDVSNITIQDKLKHSGSGPSSWAYDVLHRYKIREKVKYSMDLMSEIKKKGAWIDK